MDIIKEVIFNITDHGVAKNLPTLKEGTTVKNFQLLLSSTRIVELEQVIKNGPLVLVFIRGTWCPFCRMHLSRLRKWADSLKTKNASIIVVSSESVEAIQNWLKDNPSSYLFASDSKLELSDYFGVHINPNDYSNAATFLIDTNKMVKVCYKGKRTNENFKVLDSNIMSV